MILDWEYFKYDKPLNAPHDAILNCGISYKYRASPDKESTIKIQFEVKSYVDTAKSYFNFNLKNKDYELLKHEQGHSDLATIYALKLKEQFNKAKYLKASYHSQIKQIYTEIAIELDRQQKLYDLETEHGRNKSKQAEWDSYFKKELNIS